MKNDSVRKNSEKIPRTENGLKKIDTGQSEKPVIDAANAMCSGDVESVTLQKDSLKGDSMTTQTPKKDSSTGAIPKSTSK